MTKLLIEYNGDPETHFSTNVFSEPAFLVPSSRKLQLGALAQERTLHSYLAHRITRNPLDLKAHTQRIFLNLEQERRAATYSALLDLFIALGDRAQSLRKHLLQRCKPLLEPEQQKFFQNWLEHPSESIPDHAQSDSSLLYKIEKSSLPLIEKVKSKPDSKAFEPLTEAREYLEYGQFEQAMDVLETATIEGTATDPELLNELLAIYEHARLFERYDAHTKAMQRAGHHLSNHWLSFRNNKR